MNICLLLLCLLLESANLDNIAEKFENFHERFSKFFKTKTRDASERAKQYAQGLFSKGRENMVEFSKVVPGSDNQSLQHFISNSPWDDEALTIEIQKNVIELIGDAEHGSIHADEKGFPKDGKLSVGVKRQYCGNLGKVDNCQVGVFLGYVNTLGNYRSLLDKRLYLPEEWVGDVERRRKCGVPDDIEFKTKAELASYMIINFKNRGFPFGWAGFDGFYGEQPEFLDSLDDEGIIYCGDIPCDTRVWLEKPKVEVPPRKGNRGRKPTKKKLVEGEPPPVEVRNINPGKVYNMVLRDTERGELRADMAFLQVYSVRDGLPGKETWLIIRKDEGINKTKYQLSNAPADTPIKRLAEMSCARYWIERMFEDANGTGGLSDYEMRSWRGWHHHITMSLLVMLFLLTMLVDMGVAAPLLTFYDIRKILEVILPKKEITREVLIEMIGNRHKARLSARRSHHKRDKRKTT